VKYSIAIPSYQRAEICRQQTLATLDRMKVDRDAIHIFVANEEQAELYKATLGGSHRIIVGVRGISSQRKFYHNWFPEGEPILSLDDDISEVLERTEDKLVPTRYTINDIAEAGFNHCAKERTRLWGINPTMNNFFLSDVISVGLRYICANFMGSYGGDWVFTDEARRMTPTGEDHHSSLRAFTRYGSVVRLEYLCPKTKYFAKGGIDACVTENGLTRKERHGQELMWVQSQYPHLATVTKKAGGVINLRFKPITYAKHPRP
jgi:hypothetical protein